MRLVLLFSLILLFNCEDKKTKPKPVKSKVTKVDTIAPEIEEKVIEIDSSKLTLEERYLPLNDDNAMDFFEEYGKINKENKVRIYTKFGNIDLELFNKVKYHRANFIFLTKNKAFDGTQFHRVVKNFVIQGGNSDEPEVLKKRRKMGRYLLPPDVRYGYKHRRGTISIPSGEIENAYKLASPFEFFITQKNQFHLDGEYTAFGRVIKGMDVVDKIADQEVDGGHWPRHNIYINKVEVID
ncbi:cyclophilin family peptidyl-prolyl cis-trans isomerase [Lacinutrix venerupis]|uniref:peptidylprolyl isomerase n=1 Tax=Lacinutrix venerupis TaxID=1486034 RepID=UPI000EB2BFBD|nr:peptidylprolyl isomerase [Lacinutrix venerupis]RLJ62428.1 cyclophilin family peptidyl-prolyl cis-trans isomerase [Lacinutrix venerupis]